MCAACRIIVNAFTIIVIKRLRGRADIIALLHKRHLEANDVFIAALDADSLSLWRPVGQCTVIENRTSINRTKCVGIALYTYHDGLHRCCARCGLIGASPGTPAIIIGIGSIIPSADILLLDSEIRETIRRIHKLVELVRRALIHKVPADRRIVGCQRIEI